MDETEKLKVQQAVALQYQGDKDRAPRVVAKGSGFMAKQIIKSANQHGVPLYQNSVLSSMLMAVELDREIPPEMYQAVAEILAYIYRIDQRLGKGRR